MMMFLLQLVLCFFVGLSHICFGMENEEEKISTWKILNVTHPDFYSPSHSKNMPGKLQIYVKEHTDQLTLTAQFIPNNGPIIKFSNFHDISAHQKDIFFDNKLECPLYIPVHIYGSGKYNTLEKDIVVTKIEELNKPEELSNIAEFQVWVHADNIEIYKGKNESPVMLRNSENMGIIQQALSSEKSFLIDFMENNRVIQGQIKNYSHGLRLQLNNLISSYDLNSVKMPVALKNNNKPKMISLDLDKEEKPHSYQLGKWIGRGLFAVVLVVLAYKLKDKVYMLGDFLFQSTKAITNIESPSIAA